MTMKHQFHLAIAHSLRLALVALLTTSIVHAQGVVQFENGHRGGVHRFDADSSGVRTTAPGLHEYGRRDIPAGTTYYFGIMGAVSAEYAGTYSSTGADVELAQLVQSAQGLSDNATGMGLVIRNGGIKMQVFPSAGVTHRLLPGDLVVFQRDVSPEQAGQIEGDSVRVASGIVPDGFQESSAVEVAFLGIVEQRPIVVTLEKRFATIAHVVSALHQSPEIARTIRVIRTDSRAGLLQQGTQPQQLADGDVLAFDARFLNPVGLSQAEEFPGAIPMSADRPTSLSHGADDHTAGRESDSPHATSSEPDSVGASTPSSIEPPIAEPLRAFEEPQLPPLDFPSADVEESIPFAPLVESTDDRQNHTGSVHQTNHEFESVSRTEEPVPQLQVPDLPAAGDMGHPAPVAPSTEPEPQPEPKRTTTTFFEAAHTETSHAQTHASQAHGLIPPPIEAQLTSLDDVTLTQLRSLNTASIALAVLVLAAMCFAVSVIWSRIDRTAQELQQKIPPADASGNTGRHHALDRLIENAMPIVEERTPLPERMSYHGQEVGKRKLVIDQPHAIAGPHYSVSASTDESGTSERTETQRRPLSTRDAAVESRLDQVVKHVRTFRRDAAVETHESADAPSHTPHPPQSQPESTSHAGLLDRVLLAMERERQR